MCLDTGCTSGSWSFSPGPTNYLIAFVEISMAGTARLYEVTNYALLGSWNTNALSIEPEPIRRLSHMDFYPVLGDGANVPEPGVLLLLAVGLVGVSAIRRRRRDTPPAPA
jgi:hypothetical protein